MSKGKGGGKGKGKGKGKSKGKRFGNRSLKGATLVVQKKVEFDKKGIEKSSSLMVGDSDEHGEEEGKDEIGEEDDLYNLMRGHTSLMVTEDSSDSDEESKGEEEEDDEGGRRTSVAPELGSSSAVPELRSTAGGVFTPNWGNHPIQDPRDQEFANDWTNRSRAYYRKSRNEVMERGGTPPPKFHEDNLFTEGCSRKKAKATYRLKGESDCWDNHPEKEVLEALDDFNKGRQRMLSLQRALESDCWSNDPEEEVWEALEDVKEGRKRALQRGNTTEGSDLEESSSKFFEEEDNSEDNKEEEESSSEDGDEEGISIEDRHEDDDSSDDGVEVNLSRHRWTTDSEEDEQTLSKFFDDLYYYRSLEIKEWRRRFKNRNQLRINKRNEESVSYRGKTKFRTRGLKKEKPSAGCRRPATLQSKSTRGACIMGTREALDRLTSFEKEDYDSGDEWMIIRVPRKNKNSFFVDYCDGDTEDEFNWLEGPYRSKHLTVEDLLDRRRGLTRTSRRRKGRTQFRDDEELDQLDKDGNSLSTFSMNGKDLGEVCRSKFFSDLSDDSSSDGVLAASLNEVVENSPSCRQLKKKKVESSIMMAIKKKKGNSMMTTPLHDMECVGVDTCSAKSISCNKDDFLDLELSEGKVKGDVLRGVGGTSGVSGKGVMLLFAKDIEGKVKMIIEPKGIYLEKPPSQFRIIGQQKFKQKGVSLIQDHDDNGLDILKCKRSGSILPLEEGNGILLLRTFHHRPDEALKERIRSYVQKLKMENNFLPHVIDLEEMNDGIKTVLIMNEGKLKVENYERLLHWRFGHTNSQTLKAMDLIDRSHLNEDCYCCNQSKFKRAPFPKNEGAYVAVAEPYWRLYADGYGGQKSLGGLSHGGAKGGIVFVCPITGSLILKLYSKMTQFPAILYQVLQQVESQGFICKEIMVDTYVVNLSEAAEEVAAMFKARIIPISAGTPQELAYAESAVRTIGNLSRAMMMGAPHLPKSMWALSDLNAAYVHDVLPQRDRGNKSPSEMRTGKKSNVDHLHIKVFGCPCQFAPMDGPEHKRASKTEWGYFVGMQWPMCLVYQPGNHKIISVSRKKIVCHEGAYANFNPTQATLPATTIREVHAAPDDPNAEEDEKDVDLPGFSIHNDKYQAAVAIQPPNSEEDKTLTGVHSIKVLRESTMNQSMNEALPSPPTLNHDPPSHPENPGEEIYIPYEYLDEDSLMEKIQQRKTQSKEKSIHRKIVESLTHGADVSARNILKERRDQRTRKRKAELQVGDSVKIKTARFGKSYAMGRPEFTYGKVLFLKGSKAGVRYEGGEEIYDTNKTHLEKLHDEREPENEDIVATILHQNKWYKKKTNVFTMMAVLEVGCALKRSEESEESSWPKDFFEALIRQDWREWVEAIRKEIESWRTFNAAEEVEYKDMEQGASIIPLGELYTIKRSGQHKFRQYAMGNLLKAGKDYGDTFSSTVSGDGLRWFCSLAAACNKRIRGWDATTGYLQTKQRIKIYAYLPSHHEYSDMEYEELAEFRKRLLKIKKEKGIKGVKEFARQLRKDRRWKHEKVLELKRSVYGIPDAGQAFAMFMQGMHIKKCGLTQCEVDPAIYFRIEESSADPKGDAVVKDYLIVITWVDDVRYFGTDKFVKEYEESVRNNCKCTMEGDSDEFVSIEIKQDMKNKTVELTQTKYWEKAVERFAEFLPNGKAKERRVPLSAADERLLTEPTEQEIKEAEHLPFPNLLGVIQYPSAFSKPEMRYAMSVLSRHRTKWGKRHFAILLKSLEYGYCTRKRGIIYLGCLSRQDLNTLVAYADSSLSLPRSQGCRLIIMNGAVISFSSKRHTTTDDSTAAAELTEQYLCSCDVEGLRNLMKEVGLQQMEATKIYQDNQAAIQIANNRGQLAKKTRAMDMRTLTVRNKVEDMKVVPVYCETARMLADIGTKALEPARFELLRDAMTGYGLWEAMRQGRLNDFVFLMVKVLKTNK